LHISAVGGAHHHHPAPGNGADRALLVSLILNGSFLIVEVGVGFWTGSLALLSDAAHMVSDVAALGLALVAGRLAMRPASAAGTFGLKRAEVLGAFVNAVTLVVACLFIFNEAIERLTLGSPAVPGLPMLLVAGFGLAINLGSAWFLHRSGAKSNLNVRAALVHMLADALGSVGALVAALLILFLGWNAADAIASFVIGILVLWGAWGLLRDSARVLLEFAPPGLGQDVVERALLEIEDVAEIHELHVWMLGGSEALVTAHIVPRPNAKPFILLEEAERVLHDRFGIHHTTLQIERADGPPCRQQNCPVLPEVVQT
jgi:cobalt-zinc-cadmium efflux system protein